MRTRDVIEPTIRKMCHLIVGSGAPVSGKWANYTEEEDLVPLRTESDTEQHYVRANDGQARVVAFNIAPVAADARAIRLYPQTVRGSLPKAAFIGEVDNLGNSFPQDSAEWQKAFDNAKNELLAIEAGWEHESTVEAKATASLEGIAELEAKTTVRDRLYGSVNRQTGNTSATASQATWKFTAPPYTRVEGFLEWNEQDIVRHTENFSSYGFGLMIGRRYKPKRRGWRWASGAMHWDSLDHFCSTAGGNGSVHFALYDYWSDNPITPDHPLWRLFQAIRSGVRLPIHKYIEFKGADAIKTSVKIIDSDEPEEEE